jgi:hypothetical protein
MTNLSFEPTATEKELEVLRNQYHAELPHPSRAYFVNLNRIFTCTLGPFYCYYPHIADSAAWGMICF